MPAPLGSTPEHDGVELVRRVPVSPDDTDIVAAVEAHTEDGQLGPGLHLRTDVEPLKRAPHLAAELGGDLCATMSQADDLLAEIGALSPLTAEALELLGGLADRVAAAQRIVDRTLDRAAAEVGQRLADTGLGVAIHPSAVRDRAAAVVTARSALAAAEGEWQAQEAQDAERAEQARGVREAPPEVESVLPPPPSPPRGASFWSEAAAPRRGLLGWFRRGRERSDQEDTRESTRLLQQVAAATDEAFGARRADEARDDRLVLLGAQRDRAREDLRVAERAWSDLAGEDRVEDVEEVVRRFDPQHQDALVVAQETAGVRTVSSLLERALRRWEEGWRDLDLEPPASADREALQQVADRLARPIVLVAEAVARADEIVATAPAAPVVVLDRG